MVKELIELSSEYDEIIQKEEIYVDKIIMNRLTGVLQKYKKFISLDPKDQKP